MPGSISFRKFSVFLAAAWESFVVDSERSVLGKKSSLFVQSPAPQSPVWNWGSWVLLQVHFGQGASESVMQGAHSAIGNTFLNFSSLGVASARHNRSPWE